MIERCLMGLLLLSATSAATHNGWPMKAEFGPDSHTPLPARLAGRSDWEANTETRGFGQTPASSETLTLRSHDCQLICGRSEVEPQSTQRAQKEPQN